MPVPDYQSFMRPLLLALDDGAPRRMRELYAELANKFHLSDADMAEMLPSGRQATYMNRIGWAKTYLLKAGALESPQRAVIKISARGQKLLKQTEPISTKLLMRFPEFANFQGVQIGQINQRADKPEAIILSPEEQLEALYNGLNSALVDDLLNQIQQLTPAQFERLVVQLLVVMGYGGSVKDAGAALGRSGDDGVDGVIKQDFLGLDKIYLQAKRFKANKSVGSADIRNFIGSLDIKKADKGVFITTSTFTPNAVESTRQTSKATIVLVDGKRLASLMIEHGVGTSIQSTYLVRRLDDEFFEEL